MTAELEPQEILDLPLGDGNFSDAKTVGQYLMRMAKKAAMEGSCTYPFADSNWETPLIFSFANAKLMWLRTDENGLVDDYSDARFTEILVDLYDFLFDVDYSTMDRMVPPPEPKEWYLVCVDRDGNHPGQLTDYFGDPMTEEEARIQVEVHNKPYKYHAWSAVHIPTVS